MALEQSLDDLRAALASERRQLAEELRRIREVRLRLEATQARRESRRSEATNAAIVTALQRSLPSGPFYVTEVLAAADCDSQLQEVLTTHRLETPERLGYWLRDAGADGSYGVRRIGRDRRGVRWIISPQ